VAGVTLSVHVAITPAAGHELGARDFQVLPMAISRTPTSSPDSRRAWTMHTPSVSSVTPGARYYAYASVIDNRTGDPIWRPPPVAAAAPGTSVLVPPTFATGSAGDRRPGREERQGELQSRWPFIPPSMAISAT